MRNKPEVLEIVEEVGETVKEVAVAATEGVMGFLGSIVMAGEKMNWDPKKFR